MIAPIILLVVWTNVAGAAEVYEGEQRMVSCRKTADEIMREHPQVMATCMEFHGA